MYRPGRAETVTCRHPAPALVCAALCHRPMGQTPSLDARGTWYAHRNRRMQCSFPQPVNPLSCIIDLSGCTFSTTAMLLSANSSSLSGQRPLPCGRRSAAGLPPLRQHTAASSAVAKSSSVFYDSCAAAPRARSAGIPGGGPDVGRGLGHGPFAPAQASFVLPSPAKGYSSSRFSGHGYRGVSAAPVPPRSSSGAQLPITHPRGKPQPQPNEDDQLQAAADDAEQQCINKAAGSSAGAPAEGDAAAPVPASTPNASAVAAAQLLRGALEAVLVPRLEAMEGSIVEAVEGTIAEMMLEQEQRLVAAAETQGQRTKEEVKTMVEVGRAAEGGSVGARWVHVLLRSWEGAYWTLQTCPARIEPSICMAATDGEYHAQYSTPGCMHTKSCGPLITRNRRVDVPHHPHHPHLMCSTLHPCYHPPLVDTALQPLSFVCLPCPPSPKTAPRAIPPAHPHPAIPPPPGRGGGAAAQGRCAAAAGGGGNTGVVSTAAAAGGAGGEVQGECHGERQGAATGGRDSAIGWVARSGCR